MAQEILKLCMSKGFFLDKEMLDLLLKLNEEGAKKVIDILGGIGFNERVITKNLFDKHFNKFKELLIVESGSDEIESLFAGVGYLGEPQIVTNIADEETNNINGKVKLISAPAFQEKKITVKDFVNHFRSRYAALKTILEARNFENLSSIRRIGNNRGTYTIIAAVIDKRTTKNKNLLIKVEDMTGTSVVLVNQNKKEVFEKAKDLLVDDIVAFNVSGNSEMLFANDITFPDTVLLEKRFSEFDESVAFISDIHAGSTMFLEKNLRRFVKWLNGKEGDEEQKNLAKKVKYLFMNGDNVDGISVFPGQEKFLSVMDMKGQYKKLYDVIKDIRKDIKIIISPGQHDAVWLGEPQPIIGEEWAPDLHSMENVTFIPNPSCVEIDGDFKILVYHGASMHGIIEEIPEIRLNHGHNNPTVVVKEMLKRRHLSPMHGLSDYIPCEKDPLVIDPVPDIIITGDQHRCEVAMHNNILLIASSCWQSRTPFEEKVGNNPEPCKVPIFNLKTREIKILDFSDGIEEAELKSLHKVIEVDFEAEEEDDENQV